MPLDPHDQQLLTAMANRMFRLQTIIEALLSMLIDGGTVDKTEILKRVNTLWTKQHEALRQSQQSPDELLEEFLRKFEGPKQ